MKFFLFKLIGIFLSFLKYSSNNNNENYMKLLKNLRDYSFDGTWELQKFNNSNNKGINNKYLKNVEKGKFSIYFFSEEKQPKLDFNILFFIHEDYYNENYLTFLLSYSMTGNNLDNNEELMFEKQNSLNNGMDMIIISNKSKVSKYHHNNLFFNGLQKNVQIDSFNMSLNYISKVRIITGYLQIKEFNIFLNFTTKMVGLNFIQEFNYQINTFSIFFIMIVSFQLYYIFKYLRPNEKLNSISYYFILVNFFLSISFLVFFLYLSALFIYYNQFQLNERIKLISILLFSSTDGRCLIISLFGFEYFLMCLISLLILVKRFKTSPEYNNYLRNIRNFERPARISRNFLLKKFCNWKLIPLTVFFIVFFFLMCIYKILMCIGISVFYLLQIIFLLTKRPNNNDRTSIYFCTLISLDKIAFIMYFRGTGYLLNPKPSDDFVLTIFIIYILEMTIIWIITFFKIHMDFSFNNHEYNYFLSEKMIREILHEHLNKNEINSLTCSICLENIFLNNIEENINSSNLNNTTLTDNKIEVIENESKIKNNKTIIRKIKQIFIQSKENIKNICKKTKKSNLMITPCHHVFHSVCLENWMNVKLICPLCNHELPDFYN